MPRRLLDRLAPLLFIVALTLTFCYKLAFTDRILARGDTYAYFYPYWDARDAALRHGDLPLWTNHLFMGAPLLANSQLGTFYPPNWLTISFDAPDAIRISILLHVAWAMLGAYLLARVSLGLERWTALLAGAIFALGEFVGAHVEQINQLQGLSWMPWLFLLYDRALARPGRYSLLLAMALALQFLSGHTQTVFITGVGLATYGILQSITPRRKDAETQSKYSLLATSVASDTQRHWRFTSLLRPALTLMFAGWIALLLAAPQLVPSQELASRSNRGGGLNQHEATAFSFDPLLTGRGLLPSYETQPFGEFVAYVGVFGLGLAIVGASSLRLTAKDTQADSKSPLYTLERGFRGEVWLIIALLGLFLAFGKYNPVYWPLAALPGFNLFRVPARWLALFALGVAMLAGIGAQAVADGHRPKFRTLVIILAVILGLAAASFLSNRAADPNTARDIPTTKTLVLWGIALISFIAIALEPPNYARTRHALSLQQIPLRHLASLRLCVVFIFPLVELWLASQTLPYNDLSDPAVYDEPRFAISQLQVYAEETTPPGRILSISNLSFDPGDRAALENRWDDMGLGERATAYAFTATKMEEVLAPNLPLQWGVPSIDGYDGGLLPTADYTAFTSLLLPDGALRTIDGRLRENMAAEGCRGACLPDDRWLDLTNTRFLITDKVYDLNYEGIFYDTQFEIDLAAGETYMLEDTQNFEADSLHILYTCGNDLCRAPDALFVFDDSAAVTLTPQEGDLPTTVNGFTLLRLTALEAVTPQLIQLQAADAVAIVALSLVDTRTGDFVQLTPNGWRRVYSAEIKIYENMDVMPRAFVVHDALYFPDTWDGTEQALAAMRDPSFDPRRTVVINGDLPPSLYPDVRPPPPGEVSTAEIIEYTPTRIVVRVNAAAQGFLVLTDAFYPGWSWRLDIRRADIMFRAIPVLWGEQTIVLEFATGYHISIGLWGIGLGVVAWIIVVIRVTLDLFRKSVEESNP